MLKQKLHSLINSSKNYDEYEQKINDLKLSNKELGDAQEYFCMWYFNSHKKHYNIKKYISYIDITQSKKTFLEKFNLPSKDKGTDAVIVHTDNTFSLVQVKYRTKNISHNRSVFDGMAIDALNCKRKIKNLYLFSNCSNISEEGFKYDEDKFKFILYDTIKDIDWDYFKKTLHVSIKKDTEVVRPKLKFRNWQRNAIEFTLDELCEKKQKYVSIIAPCGSGKTLYTFGAIKKLFEGDFKVLIVVPSLCLLSQWYECFATYFEGDVNFLCVGSDVELKTESSRFDITTDEETIKNIFNKNYKKLITISTYQSLERVKNACKKSKIIFDTSFADEAHRTASTSTEENYFSMITQKTFPTKLKIYMTATPKIFKGKITEKVVSMDDENIYGKQFRYSVRQAIDDQIISDYKIVLGVCEENVEEGYPDRQRYDVYAKLLLHCIKKFNLKKILVASNSHASSKKLFDVFSKMFSEDGSKELDHELMLMPVNCRSSKKNEVISKISRGNGIIFNVKVFNLGTDIPQLDAIFFNGDKNSRIDIVQTAMRCMRKHPLKNLAYVIVPAFLGEDLEVENGDFPTVRNTLSAMGDQDEILQEEILLKCKNVFTKTKNVKSSKDLVLVENISDEIGEIDLETVSERLFDSLGEGANVLLKFEMLKNIYEETENLVRKDFVTENGFRAGSFQDCLIGALNGRNKRMSEYIKNFKIILKTLKVWPEIEKRIKNAQENRTKEKLTVLEKFKLLVDGYKETEELVKFHFIDKNGFKRGIFQSHLFEALSGRIKRMEEHIENFKIILKTLKVWPEIEKRIKNAQENRTKEKLTVLEKFKLLVDGYKETEELVRQDHIDKNGFKRVSFQNNLLGALSGRNERMREHIEKFKIILKTLKVWPEIEKRIKNTQKK